MLAGIGTPRHFEKALSGMGYTIEKQILPGDHLPPSESDLKSMEECSYPVVCTEKDIVKQSGPRSWYVAEVKWEFIEGEDLLQEKLKELIHA